MEKLKLKKIKWWLLVLLFLMWNEVNQLKKVFKGWSLFECLLLFTSVLSIIIVGAIFKSDLLTMLTSIVGVTCALLLAKGLVLGEFFGIAIVVLYSLVSYKNGFYGEMIIYIGIMLPMYVWGVFEWIKHKNSKTNSIEVNEISKKEWAIVSFIAVILFVVFYFLCINW